MEHLGRAILLLLHRYHLITCTGASHGLGKAIACCYAREGASLVLISPPATGDDLKATEKQCTSEGCARCECITADLADVSSCDQLCKQLANKNIDVLVNNAGMFGPSGEEQGPLKGDPGEWAKMMVVNVLAPMCLTRYLAPKMVDKGEGYIINIGDVEGCHTGPHHPAYAASKHGLRGFSLSCYEALREKNIKVCLVEPGNVGGTAMQEETSKGSEGQGMMTAEDVAEACMFPFRVSRNCVPAEIVLKAAQRGGVAA